MEIEKLTDALLQLATGTNRSEMARLREIYPQIKSTLSAGVSRITVLNELHRRGFTMTLRSFESAIYRLRKSDSSVTQSIPVNNSSVKIAGFDVLPPTKYKQITATENDLLK